MPPVLEVRSFVEEPLMADRIAPSRLKRIAFGSGSTEDARWLGRPVEPVDFDLALDIRGRGCRATVGVSAERRYRDGPATLLIGHTANRLAEVRFTVDPRRQLPYSFHVFAETLQGSSPEDAWPLVHFLSLARAPNEFSLGLPGRPPVWNRLRIQEPPVSNLLAKSVLQLRTIRRHTGSQLVVPMEFSRQLTRLLDAASQLIAGAVVTANWDSAEIGVPADYAKTFVVGDLYQIDLHLPLQIDVDGVSTTVERWARLRQARVTSMARSAEETRVGLAPGTTSGVLYRSGPWLDPGEQKEQPLVREGDWVAMLGEAVVAVGENLSALTDTLREVGTRPDKILRAGPSDFPAAM